jgi:cation diffusion facilitator family transporter
MQNANIRYKKAKKITIIGAIVNIFLGAIKVLGGILFKSHGLLADGIHSFSDLISDALVLIASKYGSQDADDLHTYGHQRIETAATMLLSIILIFAGIGIAWDALSLIFQDKAQTPEISSVAIAIISVGLNEVLYHLTLKTGNSINSHLLIANAWHHRSDAASSIIVLLGIIGSIYGLQFLDSLAAVIIAGMIVKMGIDYGLNSIKELVDTGVSKDKILEIEKTIYSIDGVKKIHQFRNRMMGKDIFIDLHILVDPFISVSEGHHIAFKVHEKLVKNFNEIQDVTIHVDPEDDEIASPSINLPSRKKLESHILNQWQTQFPQIENWIIHYLEGGLIIDLIINNDCNESDLLINTIKKDMLSVKNLCIINILINHKRITKNLS